MLYLDFFYSSREMMERSQGGAGAQMPELRRCPSLENLRSIHEMQLQALRQLFPKDETLRAMDREAERNREQLTAMEQFRSIAQHGSLI